MTSVNIFEILFIGMVLSMDSFSAALAMGMRKHSLKDSLRFALSSGSAEALVTFIGAMAGTHFIAQFNSFSHWVSFALLMVVALHMSYEGYCELKNKHENDNPPKEFHGFFKILIVSFATSLDAFAVGVSLGATGKTLTPFIFSIGIWAFVATIVGMSIARRASERLGPIFNLIGSLILVILAFNFLP